MRKQITALATAAALAAAAAPAALAQTNNVGNANGSPNMNICVASIDCTYINFHHGKPTDVVKRAGTIKSWTLNSASTGGQVQLRILHPAGHGKLRAIRSSAIETVQTLGVNTFAAHIKVKAGDVLALSNDTSGLYMATASTGNCVRYFSTAIADGSAGKPDRVAPALHMLLSAQVRS